MGYASNRIVTCVFRMGRVCLFDALHSFSLPSVFQSHCTAARPIYTPTHIHLHAVHNTLRLLDIIYMNTSL